jgi:hypothetical protein
MNRVLEAGMRKCALFLGILGLLVFSSCASAPKDTSPINRGSYPKGFSDDLSVTLYIHEKVGVFSLDDGPVDWENTDQRQQFVNIEPGMRVFQVAYNDGKLRSSRISITAKLAEGSYLLKPITDEEENVIFAIVSYVNGLEGEEASFYLSR